MKKIIFTTLIVLLSILVESSTYAQCAMCKASIESNMGHNTSTTRVKGLNDGIIYMMVIPYIIFGIIGYMWYKNSKKETKYRHSVDTIVGKALEN